MTVLENRWWVVFASVLGLAVGAGTIYISAFGVMLKPISDELGIGRGVFSFTVLIVTIFQAVGTIALGRLLDRYGFRRVMIPGTIAYAASVAALSLLTSSMGWVYFLFAICGVFAAFGSPVPFGTAIVAWFDRGRGFALGLAIAGVGLGSTLAPGYVQYLLGNFGWRGAYLGLAAAILLFGLIPIALFLRNPPDQIAGSRSDAPTEDLPGIPTALALKSGLFWSFVTVFAITSIAITGALTHLVPLLTDRGVSQVVAVGALSGAGLALTLGRFGGGWCLDRFWGPHVAAVFFAAPAIGIALVLYGGVNVSMMAVGVFLIGIGFGAEVDFLAFFASRYFGRREYAGKYGILFPAIGIGSGVGPVISGMTFDHFHSYFPAFSVFGFLLVGACIFFINLGPYPYPAPAAERGGTKPTRAGPLASEVRQSTS